MIHFFKFFLRIYNQTFSKDKVFVKRLKGLLGFTPANLGIFKLAFYHKSTSSEKLYAVQSNERLEYLGDAVLATIVAEYLFKKYPNSDEGFLTKMRSKIVKRQSLNTIADKMGLDVFLNQYNNTRLSKSMLGNALEALVGAVYLEKGYGGTKRFVIGKILLGYLDIKELESFDDNYKSQLLEWCQKNGKVVSYKMVSKYKFEKRDRFKVAVLIDDKKVADADDFNKKSAEQTASEKAMKILGILVAPTLDENKPPKRKTDRFGARRNEKPQRRKDDASQKRGKRKVDNRRNDKPRPEKARSEKPRPEKSRSENQIHPKKSSDRNNEIEAARPQKAGKSPSNRKTKDTNNTKTNQSQQGKTERAPKKENSRSQQLDKNSNEKLVPKKSTRQNRPANNNKAQNKPVKDNEDWEDIQIPAIKLDIPIKPVAKKAPANTKQPRKPQQKNSLATRKPQERPNKPSERQKSNDAPVEVNSNAKTGNRRNFRNRPARNSSDENPNNTPPKKELTD